MARTEAARLPSASVPPQGVTVVSGSWSLRGRYRWGGREAPRGMAGHAEAWSAGGRIDGAKESQDGHKHPKT
jgi:hypothetical protein